jgi:hypothetical protein
VEKNKSNVCSSCFGKCHFIAISFDMWMSKGTYDVSTLVVNFLGSDWWPKHMTIGLFKTTKTTSQALAVI